MKLKNRPFKIRNTKRVSRLAALAVCTLVSAVGVYMLFRSSAESFCDINPSSDAVAIEAAINGCADGSTIRFPAGASYTLIDTIFVKDRHNLVIDGRGSTFTITTDGETKPSINRIAPGYNENSYNGGNWMLLRGSNITLKNIRAIGSFPPGLNGEARDITKENRPEYINDEDGDGRYRYSEGMSNFGVYGTDGAYLEDLYGKAPWGDTITTATDHYVDNFYGEHGGETRQEGDNTVQLGNYAKNVIATRVRSEEPSRMCFALTSGRIMTVQDSYCKSAWYGGTDQEIDEYRQPLESVYFLRNTFEGFNLFGYLLPVAGTKTSDIQIKGNNFITPPDATCNPTIGLGGYPDNPEMIKGAYIDNNTIVSYGTAIQLDSVAGGSVKNNKITTLSGGTCGSGDGNLAPLVKVSARSTNVIQENNGPDAPGAGGTVAPPTPSTPTPTPAPTPTNPPASDACASPTNFAGTPGPSGSGRYDFTWTASAGASNYSLYYAVPPEQPSSAYSGPFTATAGSAYSLNVGQQYNFAVRASCGSSVSANSGVLTVTAPSSASTTPSPGLSGDVNNDGKVNFDDALTAIRKWNTNDNDADINKDGKVDFNDALLIIRNWRN